MQDRSLPGQSNSVRILTAGDPPPVALENVGGASPFLLVGDHAGNRIPVALQQLGLDDVELARHIAWDIGIAQLGVRLAKSLDALFIHQIYSRLVIDCNRRPGAPDSIPPISDGTTVPGNADVSATDASARQLEVQAPYQQAIANAIDRRSSLGLKTILVALHSFTPTMGGFDRPWHAGILHDAGDSRFARAMIDALREQSDLVVGDNEPYSMDTIDYTIPHHAYQRNLPYVEIEVRQDLLASAAGIEEWTGRLERALQRSMEALG